MVNRSYRLVFSRSRNMLVAVEETATGSGKSGETRATRRASVVRLSLRRLLPAALLALAPMLAFAQIVAGGAHAPNVIQTPNGLDQVNINRPSGAGVSVNTFNRFDVQQKGAILNNSPTMVQSQLGGMINGNPNFGPGQAAKVIVNQVNSATASQFNGALEVAGQRANVILANPSGISVNGGTFINTSRATLTTGTPTYAPDGSVSGFNVTGGNITVSGAGFNASGVDQVDLLARAVQANAAIYAKNLNVVAGANSIDYNSLNATTIAGDGAAPGVAIDVSNLGGMWANRIVLVGTEQGVGVSKRFGDSFIDDTSIPTQRRNNTFLELGTTDRHYFGAAQFDGTLAYRRGIGGLGATPDPYEEGPTYRFHMAVVDANLSVPFAIASQTFRYVTMVHGQFTNDTLFYIDDLTIGSRYTVRGFDGETMLAAERGFYWRNEFQWPVFQTGQILYAGLDYGRVYGPNTAALVGTQLAGAVIGIRGGLPAKFVGVSYDLFAGTPVYKPEGFPTSRWTVGFQLTAAF